MRQSFKVSFYLRSNYENKEGKSPVMLRIFLGGAMSNLGSTKIFVDKAQWNNRTSRQKGRSSEALAVNASLDAISANLHSLYHKYQDDQTISLDKLRSAYLGQIQEFSTFLPVFDKFIDDIRQRVGHTISKESLQKYSVLRKHFFEFLIHRYKRKDIGLMEFTPAIIQDFELYLTPVDRGFLTDEEILKIANKELTIPRLELVRDLFLFSCFTGLAYIDVANLRREHLVTMNGKTWIMTQRKKTKVESNILLLDIPKAIIEKYSPSTTSKDGKLFPILSNQKMNAYLKEIADVCGLQKRLTFHLARHTFATMSLSKGVPMESVSKMLGHTNIKTTQIYARITSKKIEHDMEQLAGKLDKFNEAMGL